ncbi:MAG TPA: VCBS repeat-containing protein, partial [Pyrinomonadaceae bacterium]|nr:VCBS repeat-containing protein [Pyrinomonadaceae bacterium]
MKINQHILAGIILSCLLAPASALAQCTTTNFEAAINVDAGTAPQDMAAGDFNSDGKTDLVITNFNNEVYILLGNTAGGPTASKLTSVNKARGVGVADFNKDGKPDLAINHENPDGSDAISILLGNGSGAFSAPVDFPTTNEGTLIVADFNNDTNPDVFSGSRSGGVSQLLLGNGTGGLSGAASKSVVLIENGVAADFNKDGKLDLVIANDGSFIAVYLGDGTGNFGPIKTFPLNRAKFLVTADFNGDNNLDVVTAGQIGGISILLGDGAGNFGAATTITLSFSPTMIVTADFNEDGKPDVAVDSGEGRIFFVLLGNGNGGFADAIGY